MLHNSILATFDMLNLAKKQNLEPTTVLRALEESLIDSKTLRIFGQSSLQKDGKLAHIKDRLKDIHYVNQVAAENGSSLFLTRASTASLEKAVEDGLGDQDVSELMKLYQN